MGVSRDGRPPVAVLAPRTVTYRMENLTADRYVWVRGTNGTEAEPLPDPHGEDPWADPRFYSIPIFVRVN